MDTLIILDCNSWECQSTLRETIIDILWHNQIMREVRAFDDEVFILRTTKEEHEVIAECVALNIPAR